MNERHDPPERREDWLRIAGDIGDRRPVDWDAETSRSGASLTDTSGLRNLEKLAAAHDRVASELDELTDLGDGRSSARPGSRQLTDGELTGTVLSHYRILERIGAGAMGVVYKARDERLDLGRIVAVKVLHAECVGDPDARQTLLREARIACSFAHPNIATIFEVGEADRRVFIAMEYVDGGTLAEAIQRRPLPIRTVVGYGIQIAAALEAAHEAGIVHRDLKSKNIVLTPTGLVKVLDFGIAVRAPASSDGRPAADRDRYGPAGSTAGTIAYMAPECLRGDAPDRRCDVWALGITLYEAVAGKRPFLGDTRVALERSIHRDDPPPLPESVPVQLRRLIERCLDKEPGRRYQRAGEVRAALEAIRDSAKPRRISWFGVGTIAAVLAIVAVLQAYREGIWPFGGAATPPASGPAVIVLPAHNASGAESQQYLSDGLTDGVINALMRISSVRVLSRQSSYAISREPSPMPTLARKHAIDYALESSIVQTGERVRVNVQLVEARSDHQVWARSYERPIQQALALDREIVLGVARSLKLSLSPSELAALGPAPEVDRAAYREYVLGRNYAAERDYRRAMASYERAARIEPSFASAHAGLAICSVEMVYYGHADPRTALPSAQASATRSLGLDSTQASAHLALAYVAGIRWDWKNARAQLERALADEPGNPEVWYGWSFYYGVLGKAREEVDAMERVVEGDPLSLRFANELGLAYLNAGRVADAQARFERVKRGGESEESRRAAAYDARCLTLRGRTHEAVAALEELAKRERAPYARAELAYALAKVGRRAAAERDVEELRRAGGLVSPIEIAAIELALAKTDAAFATLEQGVKERDSRVLWIRVDQRFEPIRQDPRFAALLRQMTTEGAL